MLSESVIYKTMGNPIRADNEGQSYFSFCLTCKRKKRMSRSPQPSKVPQTLESLHGRTAPPHCKARTRHVMEARIRHVPMGSREASFAFRGMFVVSLLGS